MFDKLMAAQGKAEEIKKRLDTISVFGEVEGGAILGHLQAFRLLSDSDKLSDRRLRDVDFHREGVSEPPFD